MPRTARIVIPNTPHHIIQRGHNREVVFVGEEDYLYYMSNLKEWKEKLNCKIYAYCLMTNHVHLIIDPGRKAENLGLLMKRVTGRQTRYVNKVQGRTGTLWEGRFRSSPINRNEYLLACCRYIELNPVRANMVAEPEEYKWSSYREKIGEVRNSSIDKDPCYDSLGDTERERRKAYKEWMKDAIPEGEWKIIREALQRGQLTGNSRYIEQIEKRIGERIEFRGQGRPRKK